MVQICILVHLLRSKINEIKKIVNNNFIFQQSRDWHATTLITLNIKCSINYPYKNCFISLTKRGLFSPFERQMPQQFEYKFKSSLMLFSNRIIISFLYLILGYITCWETCKRWIVRKRFYANGPSCLLFS